MSSTQLIILYIGVFLVGAVITQDDYCFRNSCNKMEHEISEAKTGHSRVREEFLSGNTPKVPHVSRKLTNTCCSEKIHSTRPNVKLSSKTEKQKRSQSKNRIQNPTMKIKGSKKKRKKLKRKKARKKYKEYRNKLEKRPAR